MDLLEDSFSYNGSDFDAPLIPIPTSASLQSLASLLTPTDPIELEMNSSVDYQFFSPSTLISSSSSSTIDLLSSSPSSPQPSSLSQQPLIEPIIISNNSNNYNPKPLILSTTSQLHSARPKYAASIVRNPSPLKQMSSFTFNAEDENEIGLGLPPTHSIANADRDLLDESMNDFELADRTEGDSILETEQERDLTPIKKNTQKKWSIVSKGPRSSISTAPKDIVDKVRRSSSGNVRSRSISPMKELIISNSTTIGSPSTLEDPDSSLIGFGGISSYDLLLEEDSPDLLNELLDLTMAATSNSLYFNDASIDESDSSLDMNNILQGLNEPSTTSTTSSKSTTSRLSLANLNSNNLQNGSNISPPRRFGSDLLASSTASYRYQRDSPAANNRIVSISSNFDVLDESEEYEKTPMKVRKVEREMSEEIEDGTGDMESMLREWKLKNTGGEDEKTEEINAQATPTAFRHLNLEPTMTMELNLVSPIQPSRTSTITNSPILSSIVDKNGTKKSESLFKEMKLNQSKPLEKLLIGTPSRNVLGVLNNIEARISVLASGSKDTSAPLGGKEKLESGTERLRRKLEMMKSVSKVEESIIKSTPGRIERKRLIPSSRTRTTQTLSEIYDDSLGAVTSTLSTSTSTTIAPTPIKRLPRISSTVSNTPRLIPATPSTTTLNSRKSIFNSEKVESERKDTTRDRLEKAREERLRREEARSPLKLEVGLGSSSIGSANTSGVTSGIKSRLAVASGSRTTLEQALKTKPSSLIASKYRFNPTVLPRSTTTNLNSTTRLPLTSTTSTNSSSTIIRQKSSSSSPTQLSKIRLSNANTTAGDKEGRKVLSSSTGASGSGIALKRTSSIGGGVGVGAGGGSGTGLKVPSRSRISLLPTSSNGSTGIKRPGV